VKNVARRLGSDISDEKPILDSRLPDGSRVAAVIPPCSITGVTLTIRKFNAPNFGLPELISVGSITREAADLLVKAVLERQNILISGGTGTGKTTLLSILANFVPEDDVLWSCVRTHHSLVDSLARQSSPRSQGIRQGVGAQI